MSMEEGEEIIREAREVITTEQLLHRKKKEDIVEAYNRFVNLYRRTFSNRRLLHYVNYTSLMVTVRMTYERTR
jgi:hypothetical protein